MLVRVASFSVTITLVSWLLTASASASFAFRNFEYSVFNQDQSAAVQAGLHPWALTTSFNVYGRLNELGETVPDGDLKDVKVDPPLGVVGDPLATPRCTMQQLTTPRSPQEREALPEGSSLKISGATCPDNSQVGVAALRLSGGLSESGAYHVDVYNLVPPPGIPAEFGFNLFEVPIAFTVSLRNDGSYGIAVNAVDIAQALKLFGSRVTLWGVPADASHNAQRGECLGSGGEQVGPEGGCPSETAPKPFMTLPTSCLAAPPALSIFADSWQNPVQSLEGEGIKEESVNHGPDGNPVGITGCERLDFSPSLTVTPQTAAADSPTGLEAHLSIPQNEDSNGLGEANLRAAEVTLPQGLVVNPSAANGHEACTEAQVDLDSQDAAQCSNASKIGTVVATTPLLEKPLEGAVYLAQQGSNPFGSLLAIYVVVEDEREGVYVKLAGQVRANPLTGQLTTTFDGNRAPVFSGKPSLEGEPQLPFSDLKLKFFGGPRAALMTPECGTYAASARLTPWSGTPAVTPAVPAFKIETSCGGSFAPALDAGTESNQAGGFSPFVTTISRGDQDQQLGQVSVTTPPGVLGMLSKVTLCGEPQAALGVCPAVSQIGHLTASAGAGPDPVVVPQAGRQEDPVYLTGPYKGGPFGLSIVVHGEAGPFNLGQKVVRAGIYVNPNTSQITIDTDPLPTILEGIPLDVRSATVVVDRAGASGVNQFIFNPTNCEPLSVTGTIASTKGAGASVSTRFQAANCASLPFKPTFKVSTQGRASKAKGASLTVKVTSGAGQANIAKVVVSLPKQLPARLTTLQKACTEATFAQNPASCPAASDVGIAKAVTPVLNVPVVGPAYLVSHGGAAFPDLVVILQGEGIRLDLTGNTDIKKGITTSSFGTIPDAPISSFELKLPEGSHSVLGTDLPAEAKGDLCGQKLDMPTTIIGQNGAQIVRTTKISIGECLVVRKASTAGRRKKK